MRKRKLLAGVLSAAMVLGSLTLPENISVNELGYGMLLAEASDELASGTCGTDITWSLDSEGLLTISGSGQMNDYSNSTSVPWYLYRTSITNVNISDGVTSIGENAFAYCTSIESINIPEGVTSIGDKAFYRCKSLESIVLPDSLTDIGTKVFGSCDIEIIYSDECPINGGMITLYGLDSIYEDYVEIPSNYADSYQINDTDMVSCLVGCGESVEVSSDGYIELARETWYQGSGLASTAYIEGAIVIYALIPGTSYIEVSTSSGIYYFRVDVVDYGDIYTEGVIDDFISENITDDMTDLELMEAICSFPASYDYNASYGSAKGMVVLGGGDCTASTDLIIRTCEKLGISAWSRNGSLDSGAGSGHVNAIAELNGLYYVLEAGYYEDSPRPYTVTVRTSLFSTRSVTGGLEVYQYDGNEDSAYELVIPEEIDGETVVSIGENFISYDTNVTGITIPDTVTSIGEWAFYYCTSLTHVELSSSLTSIGNYIFYQCYSLTDITIPDTVTSIGKYAFYSCTSLKEILIPDSVISIDDGAFSECSSLKELNIPASVQTIDIFAFAGCSALTSFTCDSDSEYFVIEDGVLYNKSKTVAYSAPAAVIIDLADTVESIKKGAFSYNDNLIEAIIPSNVTIITEYAFCECGNLTTVVLPDTITTIEDETFPECVNLIDINIPDTVESIGTSAFFECTSLTDFNFSDSLKSIGDYAFYKCGFTEITLPEGLTSVGYLAFSYSDCITEINLPSTLTTIGQGAFWECTGVTSLVIPEGVEYIDVGAFYGCESLTSLTIADSVQTIERSAFESCSSLTSVVIPDTVTEIGDVAFGYILKGSSHVKIDDFIVYGHPDTTAEEYADDNGFLFINIDDVQDITEQDIKIEYSTTQYTGSTLEPSVTIDGLTEGTDYTVSYENNTEVGTATVTVEGIAYYTGTYQATFSITKASQTLTASIANSSITYGGTSQITASGTGTISYSSSDTSVATVSSSGLVTATGAGTATITVTAAGNSNYNSATKTISVTVTKASQTLTASIANSSITYGSTSQITASGTGTISYSSSNTSVATVSSSGLVTATGAGTATITVTAAGNSNYNSATKTISVTVTKASQTLTASIANSSITYGGTSQISASGTGTISYASSNTSVATVSSSGLVTATGAGTATITVTAAGNGNYNSATKTISVTVTAASVSYLLGDVNEDGEIDYLDAMTVLRYDAELITLDSTQLLAGDVNGDDAVDSLDAILILRYDADLIDSF